MRQRIASLVAAQILVFSTAVVASDTAPPWSGGRVEMPEHGFAVTLPDGWIAFDVNEDHRSQVEAAEDTIDAVAWPTSEGESVLLPSLGSLERSGNHLLAISAAFPEWCWANAVREAPSTVDQLVQTVLDRAMADPATTDLQKPQWVQLPSGPARAISWSEDGYPTTQYLLSSASASLLIVRCTVRGDRPVDDWRFIADTLEFLPEPEG